MPSESVQKIKIFVVGPHDAGKTRLAMGKNTPTIGADLRTHTISERSIKVSVWEISGNPLYDQATKLYYQNIDYVLLCVSLDQAPQDFLVNLQKQVSHFQNKIADQNPLKQNQIPIMLIGTKADEAQKNGHLAANKLILRSQLKEGETAFITCALDPDNAYFNMALKSNGTEEPINSSKPEDVFNGILEKYSPKVSTPSYRYSLNELNGKVITLTQFRECLDKYKFLRDKTWRAYFFEDSFGSGTIKALHQLYTDKLEISAQHITGEEILKNVSKKKQSSTNNILQKKQESQQNPLEGKINHGTEHVLILLLQNMVPAPEKKVAVSNTNTC